MATKSRDLLKKYREQARKDGLNEDVVEGVVLAAVERGEDPSSAYRQYAARRGVSVDQQVKAEDGTESVTDPLPNPTGEERPTPVSIQTAGDVQPVDQMANDEELATPFQEQPSGYITDSLSGDSSNQVTGYTDPSMFLEPITNRYGGALVRDKERWKAAQERNAGNERKYSFWETAEDTMGSFAWHLLDSSSLGLLGLIGKGLEAGGITERNFWNQQYEAWGSAETGAGRAAGIIGEIGGFFVPFNPLGKAVQYTAKGARALAGTGKAVKGVSTVAKGVQKAAGAVEKAGESLGKKSANWLFSAPERVAQKAAQRAGGTTAAVTGDILGGKIAGKLVSKMDETIAKSGVPGNVIEWMGTKWGRVSGTERMLKNAVDDALAVASKTNRQNILKKMVGATGDLAEQKAVQHFAGNLRKQLLAAAGRGEAQLVDDLVLEATKKFQKSLSRGLSKGGKTFNSIRSPIETMGLGKGLVLEFGRFAAEGAVNMGVFEAVKAFNNSITFPSMLVENEHGDVVNVTHEGWDVWKNASINSLHALQHSLPVGAAFHTVGGLAFTPALSVAARRLGLTGKALSLADRLAGTGDRSSMGMKKAFTAMLGLNKVSDGQKVAELMGVGHVTLLDKAASVLGISHTQPISAAFMKAADAMKPMGTGKLKAFFGKFPSVEEQLSKGVIDNKDLSILAAAHKAATERFGAVIGESRKFASEFGALSDDLLKRINAGTASKAEIASVARVLDGERNALMRQYRGQAAGVFAKDFLKMAGTGTYLSVLTGGFDFNGVRTGEKSLGEAWGDYWKTAIGVGEEGVKAEKWTGLATHMLFSWWSASHSKYKRNIGYESRLRPGMKLEEVERPAIDQVSFELDRMERALRYAGMDVGRTFGTPVFENFLDNIALRGQERMGNIEDFTKILKDGIDRRLVDRDDFEILGIGDKGKTEFEQITIDEIEVARKALTSLARSKVDVDSYLLGIVGKEGRLTPKDGAEWVEALKELPLEQQHMILARAASAIKEFMIDREFMRDGDKLEETHYARVWEQELEPMNGEFARQARNIGERMARWQRQVGIRPEGEVIQDFTTGDKDLDAQIDRFMQIVRFTGGPKGLTVAEREPGTSGMDRKLSDQDMVEIREMISDFEKGLHESGISDKLTLKDDAILHTLTNSLLVGGRSSAIDVFERNLSVASDTEPGVVVDRDLVYKAIDKIVTDNVGGRRILKPVDWVALKKSFGDSHEGLAQFEQFKGLYQILATRPGAELFRPSTEWGRENSEFLITEKSQIGKLWQPAEFEYSAKMLGEEGFKNTKHRKGLFGLLEDAGIALVNKEHNHAIIKRLIAGSHSKARLEDGETYAALTEEGMIYNDPKRGRLAIMPAIIVDKKGNPLSSQELSAFADAVFRSASGESRAEDSPIAVALGRELNVVGADKATVKLWVETTMQDMMTTFHDRVQRLIDIGILDGYHTDTGRVDGTPLHYQFVGDGGIFGMQSRIMDILKPFEMGLNEQRIQAAEQAMKELRTRYNKTAMGNTTVVRRADRLFHTIDGLLKKNDFSSMRKLHFLLEDAGMMKFKIGPDGRRTLSVDLGFLNDPKRMERALIRLDALEIGRHLADANHVLNSRSESLRNEIKARKDEFLSTEDHSHGFSMQKFLQDVGLDSGPSREAVAAEFKLNVERILAGDIPARDLESAARDALLQAVKGKFGNRVASEAEALAHINKMPFHEIMGALKAGSSVETHTITDQPFRSAKRSTFEFTSGDGVNQVSQLGGVQSSDMMVETKAGSKVLFHEVMEASGLDMFMINPISYSMGLPVNILLNPTLAQKFQAKTWGQWSAFRQEGDLAARDIGRESSPVAHVHIGNQKIWGFALPKNAQQGKAFAKALEGIEARLEAVKGNGFLPSSMTRALKDVAILKERMANIETSRDAKEIVDEAMGLERFKNVLKLLVYEKSFGAGGVVAFEGMEGAKLSKRVTQAAGASNTRLNSKIAEASWEHLLASDKYKNNAAKLRNLVGFDEKGMYFKAVIFKEGEYPNGKDHSGVSAEDGMQTNHRIINDLIAMSNGYDSVSKDYGAIKGSTFVMDPTLNQATSLLTKPAFLTAGSKRQAFLEALGVGMALPTSVVKVGSIEPSDFGGMNFDTAAQAHRKGQPVDTSGVQIVKIRAEDMRFNMAAHPDKIGATKSKQSTSGFSDAELASFNADLGQKIQLFLDFVRDTSGRRGLEGVLAAREFMGDQVSPDKIANRDLSSWDFSALSSEFASPTTFNMAQVEQRIMTMFNNELVKQRTKHGSTSVLSADENNVLDATEGILPNFMRHSTVPINRGVVGIKRTRKIVNWNTGVTSEFATEDASANQRSVFGYEGGFFNTHVGGKEIPSRVTRWTNQKLTAGGKDSWLFQAIEEFHAGGGNRHGDAASRKLNPILDLFSAKVGQILEGEALAERLGDSWSALFSGKTEKLHGSLDKLVDQMKKSGVDQAIQDRIIDQFDTAWHEILLGGEATRAEIKLDKIRDLQDLFMGWGDGFGEKVGYEYERRHRELKTAQENANWEGMTPVTYSIAGLSQRSPSSKINDLMMTNFIGFHEKRRGNQVTGARDDVNDVAESDYDIDKLNIFFDGSAGHYSAASRLRNHTGGFGDMHGRSSEPFSLFSKDSYSESSNSILRYDLDQMRAKRQVGSFISARAVGDKLISDEISFETKLGGQRIRIKVRGDLSEMQSNLADRKLAIDMEIQRALDTAGSFMDPEVRAKNPVEEVLRNLMEVEILDKDGNRIGDRPIDIREIELLRPLLGLLQKANGLTGEEYIGAESTSRNLTMAYNDAAKIHTVLGNHSKGDPGDRIAGYTRRIVGADWATSSKELRQMADALVVRTKNVQSPELKLVEALLQTGSVLDSSLRDGYGFGNRENERFLREILGQDLAIPEKVNALKFNKDLRREVARLEAMAGRPEATVYDRMRLMERKAELDRAGKISDSDFMGIQQLKPGLERAHAMNSTIAGYSVMLTMMGTPDLSDPRMTASRLRAIQLARGETSSMYGKVQKARRGEIMPSGDLPSQTLYQQAVDANVMSIVDMFAGKNFENFDRVALELMRPEPNMLYKHSADSATHYGFTPVRQDMMNSLMRQFPGQMYGLMNRLHRMAFAVNEGMTNGDPGAAHMIKEIFSSGAHEMKVGEMKALATGMTKDRTLQVLKERMQLEAASRGASGYVVDWTGMIWGEGGKARVGEYSTVTDPVVDAVVRMQHGIDSRISIGLNPSRDSAINLFGLSSIAGDIQSIGSVQVNGVEFEMNKLPEFKSFKETAETADTRAKQAKMENGKAKLDANEQRKAEERARGRMVSLLQTMSHGALTQNQAKTGKMAGAGIKGRALKRFEDVLMDQQMARNKEKQESMESRGEKPIIEGECR
jgi:hypothetical protein